MKKILTVILSALMLTLPCGQANAQNKDKSSDYNLQKAYDVLNEENDEEKALQLVREQLRATPDNVEALLLSARLNRRKGEYRSLGHQPCPEGEQAQEDGDRNVDAPLVEGEHPD